MYTLTSCCQLLIHILLKHPILAVAMGIVSASIFVTPMVKTPDGFNTEWAVASNPQFDEKIKKLNGDPNYLKKMDDSEKLFQALLSANSGDPGMTKAALKDLEKAMNQGEMGKYPDCPIADQVSKSDNETKALYARLYFYDQMRKYDNPDLAILAYRFGPANMSKIAKQYKAGKLPKEQRNYLKKVKGVVKNAGPSSR